MGEYRFRIPTFWEIGSRHTRTIYVIGMDGLPQRCSARKLEGQLVIARNQNESGRVFISYPFSTRGELTICTGTLPESETPYDLATELARGTANRLRNQTSIWEEGGLTITSQIKQLGKQAVSCLGKSIVSEGQEKDELAHESLDFSIGAIFALCDQFGQEISEFRVSESGIPPFWLATPWPDKIPKFRGGSQVFDLFSSGPDLNRINSIFAADKKAIAGPLLDASPQAPFCCNYGDFQSGRVETLNSCERMLETLQNQNVSLIHAVCNLNGIGHRNLSCSQQVQLTTDILARIEDSNADTPVMVSFDYPWAERIAWSLTGVHPIQIVEDLLRNDARFSFIGLEINLDYWPNGSIARDPLQWIDMLDVWCQFGLPLVLCLRIPQRVNVGKRSDGDIELDSSPGENVTISIDLDLSSDETGNTNAVNGNSIRENLTENQRYGLVQTILPMVVARPGVHGILWSQWSDDEDLRFPDGGLVDKAEVAKPTIKMIEEFRESTLNR